MYVDKPAVPDTCGLGARLLNGAGLLSGMTGESALAVPRGFAHPPTRASAPANAANKPTIGVLRQDLMALGCASARHGFHQLMVRSSGVAGCNVRRHVAAATSSTTPADALTRRCLTSRWPAVPNNPYQRPLGTKPGLRTGTETSPDRLKTGPLSTSGCASNAPMRYRPCHTGP